MTRARRGQVVLAGVLALQLLAETSLTPYWPLMFRHLFGLDELAATGGYLAVCRVVGLAALPLWGLAALRWPVRTLLVAGLLGCAVFDLLLAVAPTWWLFTACSAAVVACGSVLVLAYPALVEVVERGGRAGRRAAVVRFWVVFHVTAVLSTLIGAAIVALPQPRWGLGAFAVVDLALALLVWAAVPASPPRTPRPAPPAPAGRSRRRPWIVLVLAVVAVDAAVAVHRPFLVELLLAEGLSPAVAGWLFLAPAVGALLILPAAAALQDRLGRACAPVAAVLAAAGLAGQALTVDDGALWGFLGARLLFGAGLGVLLIVVDLAVFARVGTAGAAFSAVETGRSAALLAAPLVATALAGHRLETPLLAGALLFVMAAVLLLGQVPHPRSTARPPTPEFCDALDPAP